ncbi:MAG: ABC transporter permease [Candidatus Leucobacter sulfamidivorax]|nr:ABC transporter permease [Candidatus Leucobacter sulfamidivorax]
MSRPARIALELVIPVLVIAVWWWWSAGSESLYFPPLSEILVEFWNVWIFAGTVEYLVPTLVTFAVGYSIAIVVGIAGGVLLASSAGLYRFFSPLLEFLRALPAIAIVPAFISALGIDMTMRISVVAFASVWPVLLNTIDGVRGIDGTVRDTTAVFRVNSLQQLMRVTLPGASPQIFAGVRVGLALSLIVVIVTEMVVSAEGVGAFARSAQYSFDLPGMWTAILLMGVVGYLLNKSFDYLERRVLKWHLGMRGRK